MQRHIRTALFALAALAVWQGASAQHTLGFTVGYGMGNGRFQPQQEMRAIWGLYSGGLSWRYYGKQRFVGGFGIDLEFQQQGFSFATNASQVEEKKDYLYYTRHVNSVVLPIVWQPHFYMLRNHVRIYLEAAATFSYNISSTYENEQARANQIQKDVAEIFQKEGAPIVRGSLVTVTAVRISPDFSYAKIYVSIFPFEQSGEVMKRLEHQNWFIRRALGQRLRNQLKNVPEIQFLLDDSLEYIEHIEQALKED